MTKFKAKKLEQELRISKAINVSLVAIIIFFVYIFMINHNSNQNEYVKLSEKCSYLQDKTIMIAQEKDEYYAQLAIDNSDMAENITILSSMLVATLEQNKSLADSNENYYKELEEFLIRDELYDKYEYAIIDRGNNRTDITYDQLLTLESLCKDASVNDPDLYLAWIMTESNGREKVKNANSSAKGYGQFLDSTAKYVYQLMGKEDEWYSELGYDGVKNMEMMVYYVSYLFDLNNGNLDKTIDSYRGTHSEPYITKLNSYLSTKNKTIDSIAEYLGARYNMYLNKDEEALEQEPNLEDITEPIEYDDEGNAIYG